MCHQLIPYFSRLQDRRSGGGCGAWPNFVELGKIPHARWPFPQRGAAGSRRLRSWGTADCGSAAAQRARVAMTSVARVCKLLSNKRRVRFCASMNLEQPPRMPRNPNKADFVGFPNWCCWWASLERSRTGTSVHPRVSVGVRGTFVNVPKVLAPRCAKKKRQYALQVGSVVNT